MNTQLCLNRDYNLQEILKSKYYYKVNEIVINSGQIATFPDKTKPISALIDYPYGLGNTSIREHEVLMAIRSGATSINPVLNNIDILGNDIGHVLTELNTLRLICRERKVKLIPILEYSIYDSYTILDICSRFCSNSMTSIVIGTGTIVDDVTNNLITCQQIKSKLDMEVIPCLYSLSSKQIESFSKINVDTIRIMSISSIAGLLR